MNLSVILSLCMILFQHTSGAILERGNTVPEEPEREEEKTRGLVEEPQTEEDQIRGFVEEPLVKAKARALVQKPQFMEKKGLSVAKRAGTAVSQATIYKSDGSSSVKTVEQMCVFAHNYVRGQHKKTPNLAWDANLAAKCQSYALDLVGDGHLAHSTGSNSGEFGENLYVSANSYGAVSTPAHAVYSWYSESWDPKPYDYSFNPTDTSQLKNAGVGHFTAAVWKGSTSVGCGVATKTYQKDGFTMTRTVVVARYLSTGNHLGQFTTNVKPLASGAGSLQGQIRMGDLLPGSSSCKNTVAPSTCSMYKGSGFCSVVETDCNCQCA